MQVFLASAYCIRLAIPLGLNMCPPFHSIAKSERPASIIPPARTVIEDETRRNVFWLAYATERESGCGNGWALSLDDQDISQLLPVRGDQFEQGVRTSTSIRSVTCHVLMQILTDISDST
jgi:Fungal specific transcription factor domain